MSMLLKLRKRLVAATICAFGLFIFLTLPGYACGGLVAPNGAVRLERATTLVAWHGGIEHYMTTFTYQGDVSNLGWIVPLPVVPLKIEEGGAWTLQRLFNEVHPAPPKPFVFQQAATDSGAQVLQQVKVEALNITVVKGNGQEVINWATSNGFTLDGDTSAHLLAYAKGSPIFMAAKYDVAAARARHQLQGDGAPVLITMKTAHPWVPFEVLALDGQRVQADLYLLTDMPVNTSDSGAAFGQSAVGSDIPGAPGFHLAFQEKMTDTLFQDISTDRNMSWVQPDSWLTYLSLDAPDTQVRYDLGVSTTGVIRVAPFGTAPMAVVDSQNTRNFPSWLHLPLGTPEVALGVVLMLCSGGLILFWFKLSAKSIRVQSKPAHPEVTV